MAEQTHREMFRAGLRRVAMFSAVMAAFRAHEQGQRRKGRQVSVSEIEETIRLQRTVEDAAFVGAYSAFELQVSQGSAADSVVRALTTDGWLTLLPLSAMTGEEGVLSYHVTLGPEPFRSAADNETGDMDFAVFIMELVEREPLPDVL